jgi:hypothetical protein
MGNFNFNRKEKKSSDTLFRSMSQDAYKAIKEEVIDFIYPKRMVDGIDIGEICSKFNWRILSSLKHSEQRMTRLQDLLRLLYDNDINPEKSDLWRAEWSRLGLTGISERIETFRDVGRISAMDKLEKEDEYSGKDFNERRW